MKQTPLASEEMFKVEKLKPLTCDNSFNFYFRNSYVMSRPLFKDLRKVSK